jgi:hypothetical protein
MKSSRNDPQFLIPGGAKRRTEAKNAVYFPATKIIHLQRLLVD